jgi:hypothetical protein
MCHMACDHGINMAHSSPSKYDTYNRLTQVIPLLRFVVGQDHDESVVLVEKITAPNAS